MIMPVSIDYGRFRRFGIKYPEGIHLGYDFDCPQGTIVRSIADGIVEFSANVKGFGSMYPSSPGGVIIIKHQLKNKSFMALYGHITRLRNVGDKVKEGEIIGKVINFTSKGESLPHLHVGIYDSGALPAFPWGYDKTISNWIDPVEFIRKSNA
jgi:murein DD-endopeptidase MepM/ murein hydrolase activator NlpD